MKRPDMRGKYLFMRPLTAKLIHDTELLGKMDPQLEISIGDKVYRTNIAKGEGKTPSWTDTFTHPLSNEIEMTIRVLDIEQFKAPDLVGENKISLFDVYYKKTTYEWHDINFQGKNAGKVLIALEVMNQPTKIPDDEESAGTRQGAYPPSNFPQHQSPQYAPPQRQDPYPRDNQGYDVHPSSPQQRQQYPAQPDQYSRHEQPRQIYPEERYGAGPGRDAKQPQIFDKDEYQGGGQRGAGHRYEQERPREQEYQKSSQYDYHSQNVANHRVANSTYVREEDVKPVQKSGYGMIKDYSKPEGGRIGGSYTQAQKVGFDSQVDFKPSQESRSTNHRTESDLKLNYEDFTTPDYSGYKSLSQSNNSASRYHS